MPEYQTLKRSERDLDAKSSAYQLHLLENLFKYSEHKKNIAKRSRTIENNSPSFDGHKIHRRNLFTDLKSHKRARFLRARKAKSYFKKLTHRNIISPSYFYEPIDEVKEDTTDDKYDDMNPNPTFSFPRPLNTMASPQERGLTTGTKNTLDQKVLDVLKRVGLGLVTISDLSLGITATMKEVVIRVSGKAAPKVIGGWFNFEIIRKDIFAVAFTAEQAGFEDFVEKMFNTKLSLFEKLEQTTVGGLLIIYLNSGSNEDES